MHVVVVGCGRVGSELAGRLEHGGHSVAVIDKNPSSFRRLPDGFGGTTVRGFGFDRDDLAAAGIERADALAAVTSGDNTNILTARIAQGTFAVERVVARIYDPRRALIYQRLGISTVATVAWTTDQVMRRLVPAGATADWVDPSGKICLAEREVPAGAIAKRLSALNEPGRFWITAVTRFGEAQIVTPDTVGQDGDILHFTAAVDALADLEERLERAGEH